MTVRDQSYIQPQDASSKTPMGSSTEYFTGILHEVYTKVKTDPKKITTEDARRLSENLNVADKQAALIVSAVENYAAANEMMNEVTPELGQAPRTSLPTLMQDLEAAIDANPGDISEEVVKKGETIINKMRKVLTLQQPGHLELEAELRQELARIEPKVADGTVTVEEANHLHSLSARVHGHTEKGGLTSLAQSVSARRERQNSLSSGSFSVVTGLSSRDSVRSRANSVTISPEQQPLHDKKTNLHEAKEAAPSKASEKRHQGLSDVSNRSVNVAEENHKHRKEQSEHGENVDLKVAELAIDSKMKNDTGNTKIDATARE